MKPILRVSAAVLIAAISALPALAATETPKIVVGTKTGIAPVVTLDGMLGKWGKPEMDALAKARSVTVFDANKLYAPADLKLLAAATPQMRLV